MSVRPFTDERHDRLREKVGALAARLPATRAPGDAARALAAAGLFELCAPAERGGAAGSVSPLGLVVAREALAGVAADADAALAVQTLTALPIAWAGSAAQRARLLPALADGRALGAFALTERASGSDVAALATTATREASDDQHYRIDGEKALISGALTATTFVVFARTGAVGDKRAITAFVVPRESPGISVAATPNLGEHELATVRLDGVRVPTEARLGAEGDGVALALRTLELMRPTVGAAACGMAARALEETRARVRERRRGGVTLGEHESVRMRLAELATELEAARVLVYRAAWLRETSAADARLDGPASMAKLFATEAAGRIVDAAVQLHGGDGVVRGGVVERLYREVRALRIYEGPSEIQKLIIARALD
ncbi:MAG TPA: acyl-CoA dehydrogenase family protein [Polyangia bacterium]|nr:acyl-CoA dehydrogenase family protein [Polyangia bacterium]